MNATQCVTGWETVRAGDVGRFGSGSGFPVRYQGERRGDYPFFKVSDMNRDGNDVFMVRSANYITDHTRKALGAVVFPAKSIVFAKVGAAVFLDRKRILVQPSCLDNNMAAFVPTDETRVDPSFAYFLLLTIRLSAFASTTALPALSGSALSGIQLSLPPIPEQRAIATVLSDVDEMIASLEALIAKKRAIRKAAMQELLTGRTRLLGSEGEWETKRMEEVAVVTMGQSPPSASYNVVAEGLPLIQGRADIVGRTTIDRIWTSQPDKRCDAGDVVLTVRAPVGSIARASKRACLGRGVCGVKPLVDDLFLYYALILRESDWEDVEQGSTFTAANSSQVCGFRIDLPTAQLEQEAIAAVLSDMDAEITALEHRLDKTRAIKQGVMQQLLTGLIRLPIPDYDAQDGDARAA